MFVIQFYVFQLTAKIIGNDLLTQFQLHSVRLICTYEHYNIIVVIILGLRFGWQIVLTRDEAFIRVWCPGKQTTVFTPFSHNQELHWQIESIRILYNMFDIILNDSHFVNSILVEKRREKATWTIMYYYIYRFYFEYARDDLFYHFLVPIYQIRKQNIIYSIIDKLINIF